jgi:hypothetical protein
LNLLGVRTLRSVSAEQVALIPQCAECGEVWLPADEDRWYGEREFGEWR